MIPAREVVITGLGVVSPIGIGTEAFWSSLVEGRSGIRPTSLLEGDGAPRPIGGEVCHFDPKQFVRQRKSLKLMSRDIQLAVAAAELASKNARLDASPPDPDRLGIVFGSDMILCELEEMVPAYRGCMVDGKFQYELWGKHAMSDLFPLWMLKYLPNMPACHIAIAQDARGHNNTLTLAEVSSLAAIGEAMRVIQRGQADVIIAGGASSRLHPSVWSRRAGYQLSNRLDDPAAACRPFDADRDGTVWGEGAAAFVMEDRRHAEARGAAVLAMPLAHASAFEPRRNDRPLKGDAIRAAIRRALREAELSPNQIGHVNAHGMGTTLEDQVEAQAIRDTLADVPVTAPKSYFGNLVAGAGAVEMAVSVLGCQRGTIPPTLNYQRPDPLCPVNVIHGQPLNTSLRTAMVLNHVSLGRAVAMVIAYPG